MANVPTELLRALPQVEEVLSHPYLAPLEQAPPHRFAADAVRSVIDRLRQRIISGERPEIDLEEIAYAAAVRALSLGKPSLRRVVNASGVVIHTNLGRSPLAPEAIAAVNDVITGYSTLEYSVQNMARGSRHNHCERLISAITGAEAAIAVNNNAAAVMMVLNEFARGREAIVSRGELIEIGGSFRIPDIMEQSNARMVEVGATNKTHLADYERAITPDTAMLLKVHPSNFLIQGFTESVGIAELRRVADSCNKAHATGIPLMIYEDQGSGAFVDLTSAVGSRAESTIAASLKAGADLVSFSGDKLLGGPQAGIIVGRKEYIDRLKKNPLARVLRLDKMTLAALEATLRLYLSPDATRRIPTLRMLTESADDVRKRVETLRMKVADRLPRSFAKLEIVPEISRAGGGALPMYDIPTYALQMEFLQGTAQRCDEYLVRQCPIPIIARLSKDRLLFDGRTILSTEEVEIIADGICRYFAQMQGGSDE